MPIYDWKCTSCGYEFDRFIRISSFDELKDKIDCPVCHFPAKLQIAPVNYKVFLTQPLRDLCHDAPVVRNKQEVRDAINRFNDTELARKQGRVALAD